MTPRQIYEMPAERVELGLSHLVGFYYNHIEEISDAWRAWLAKRSNHRVEIKFIKDFYFDHRRVWTLATVWFDKNPVMIIQNAGREGDDHAERFITNKAAYIRMIDFISPLTPTQADTLPATIKTVGMDADIPELTEFYGQRLDQPFERYTY